MIVRVPSSDRCQCIRSTLERFADTRERRIGRGAPLYKFGERRDGDRSSFARCAVGHCLENRSADTSFDGIATHGQIRVGDRFVTFHSLCGAFERGLATFNRRGNPIERHALGLPFRHLAFQQAHGHALAARVRNRGIDALLSALPTLCKCGKSARRQQGDDRDGNESLHGSSPQTGIPAQLRLNKRRTGDDTVTSLCRKAAPSVSRALSTRIFNALTDAPSRSAIVS